MKKWILFVLILVAFCLPAFTIHAADTSQKLTFEWQQADKTNLKEWKLYWSDTSGGPYDTEPVAVIPYDPAEPGPTYTSATTPTVQGNQASHVIKYFVMLACGDIPQADGSTKYECSANSNEESWDFWIPAGMFSIPIEFTIKVFP